MQKRLVLHKHNSVIGDNNMEKTMNLVESIFQSCLEDMREQVREGHTYGSEIQATDRMVLRYSPKNWTPACAQRLDELKRQFIKRCRNSGMIFGNKKEIVDAFNDLASR